MITSKKITCVIPARLKSTRLPNKILLDLGGKTLMERVWERANSVKKFTHVVFALDSEEAKVVADSIGANYVMTDPRCPTGTHRLIELATISGIHSDIWVNWQADEPFISDKMIDDLLQGINDPDGVGIWTLKKELTNEEWNNPNVVKVVTDIYHKALFFSRLPIPYHRDGEKREIPLAFKHIGIYAYSDPLLNKIAALPESPLAQAEKLEQLTYLENGFAIRAFLTGETSLGIDTKEDLTRAALVWLQRGEQHVQSIRD